MPRRGDFVNEVSYAAVVYDLTSGAVLEQYRDRTTIQRGDLRLPTDPLKPASASLGPHVGLPPLDPASVATVAAAAAAVTFLAHGGYATVLYSRLARSDLLARPIRRTLHDIVARHPGIHLTALAKATGRGFGTTRYHLRVLERGGVLARVSLPGYHRYFVTGTVPPGDLRSVAELHAGSARRVYEVVRAQPGITLSEVARRVEVSPPAAHKTVERLQRAGLVEKRIDGRQVRLTAREVGSRN
jgi:predicted transcriptional regulator